MNYAMQDRKRESGAAAAQIAAKGSRWQWIFLMYLLLAMASVRTKAFITIGYFNGALEHRHQDLLNGVSTAPNQYRLLEYYVPEWIHSLFHVSVTDAYIAQCLVWTALIYLTCHLYLRKWFDLKVSVIGTLFLAATMQWTYFDHLKESEPLNLLIFILGFYAIREDSWTWLLRLLVVGSFNKLTVIYLPAVYFQCGFRVIAFSRLITRTALLFLTVVIISVGIYWYYRNSPYETDLVQISYNLSGLAASLRLLPLSFYRAWHLGVLFLYGIFWITAFISWKAKPLFLRRAALIIPFFIFGHLMIARIDESRLFLPLAPIIIPMGLWYLFPGR